MQANSILIHLFIYLALSVQSHNFAKDKKNSYIFSLWPAKFLATNYVMRN